MGTKVPGYKRSQERKFPGTFVPGNGSSGERKGMGTKVPGTFVPGERKFSIGNFCSRNERTWVRKVCNSSVSSVVDGISTDDGIADLFASKYQSLYTSVLYYRFEMESIHCLVDKSLSTSFDQHLIVGLSDVTNAINELKTW